VTRVTGPAPTTARSSVDGVTFEIHPIHPRIPLAESPRPQPAHQHPLTIVGTGIVVHPPNPDAGTVTHAVES
jgi:hypothetical protein